jgi:hypothetical protein
LDDDLGGRSLGPLGFYSGTTNLVNRPNFTKQKRKKKRKKRSKHGSERPRLTIFLRNEALEEDGEAGAGDAAATEIETRLGLTGDVEAWR